MTESLWWIKQSDLFRRLSEERLQRLEAVSRCCTFAARSPLVLPAEKSDNVFLLTEGMVKVSHLTDDARESILAFIEPGELFGELAILDDTPRQEYVVAVERSTVVSMPAAELRELMTQHADLAIGVTKLVGLRRRRIERRLRNLLFRSNRERLIHLLLDLAEQFGVVTQQGVELRVRLSHQDLAGLIGSTRESVTVLIGELKESGDIGGGRRRVILHNPNRLAKAVDRDAIRLPSCNKTVQGPQVPCLGNAAR